MNKPVVFTTSGTVQADEGTYLKRRADDQLLRLCQRGEYAYILTARQMGKSSLMMATSEQLRRQGIQTVVVDFQRIGAQTATASQWYLGILMRLARQLRIAPELMQWWEAHQYLGEVQRLVQFFEEVLLAHIQGRVVVFFDEIDSTLGLDFTDDFFIALRYCYTARAENPAFKRLSFVLLGVATPSELIADSNRTPFNIGTLVELTDFNEAEAMPLAAGLGLPQEMARNVLRWILQWTDGHPYLTQSACQEVVRQGGSTWTEAAVKQLIHRLFFGERREQDRNLQFVQKTLIGRAPGGDVVGVLSTYREVRCGRGAVYDEDQSLVKAHLKLSGVVKRVGSRLEVRNPIYRRVFDWRWIQAQEEWPEVSWWERIKPAMPLIAGLSAVVVLTGGSLVFAVGQRNDAVEARNEAEQERDNALAAQQAAEEERNRADQERQRAEAEEKRADSRRAEAEAANQLAEERRQEAVLAQQAEVEQRQRAELGEQEANYQAEIARQAQQQSDENAARAQRNANEANAQTRISHQRVLREVTSSDQS